MKAFEVDEMILDEFMPRYDFNEVHSIVIKSTREKIFIAMKEVTSEEIMLLSPLFFLRSLPARILGKKDSSFNGRKPLIDLLLEGGFVMLGEEADREIAFGVIEQFWKITGGESLEIKNAQEFLDFKKEGYAKAAANFFLEDVIQGMKVTTETRIQCLDEVSKKRFSRYWFFIRTGSAILRMTWLRAIKKRAESL